MLLFGISASARDKGAKGSQIEVLEFAAHRSESLVSLDAHVKNSEDKPIHNLTLIFTFTSADKTTVTTQRAAIDEESLAPGEETTVHAQIEDPPRAVYVSVSATDSRDSELRVDKPGPYAID